MSRRALKVVDIAEELKCGICMEVYNDPRMLPCGHTYCMKELRQYLDGRKTLLCPQCQKMFKGDVDTLPVNLIAKNLAEKYREDIAKKEAEQAAGEIQLFYVSFDGRHRSVTVRRTDVVLTLKSKISEKEGFEVRHLYISYRGKPLADDSKPLVDYDIQNLHNIDVNRRVVGGFP